MSKELIELLKSKYFDTGNASAHFQSVKEPYSIKKYASHDNINDDFLKDLENDLLKPIEQKNFSFYITDMKGFKRTTILSFIKRNNSLKDFENAFHSFYKNFGIDDLFNNLYIKPDYSGKLDSNHPYSPYVLFLLKQDYKSNHSFSSDAFLNALSFNFKSTESNYVDLKESIYVFLSNHYEKAKEYYVGGYSQKEERIRSFDLNIYERVKRHIKDEDLSLYNKFWKSIIIEKKSNPDTLFSSPKEEFFIFNIEHSYLTENYASLTNSEYSKSACEFVCNLINNNFSEYFNMKIIKRDDLFSLFICEFKNNKLTKDNLQHIIKESLQIHEDCKLIEKRYLRNEYQSKYSDSISKINKEITYFVMENTTPKKEISKNIIKKI